jgi:formate/nitrite transporter FocA (FNT family)
MSKSQKKPAAARSIRTYLTLSFVAAVFVAVLVFFGTGGVDQAEGSFQRTAIWFGLTFIVSLVGIATLALTVKEDDADPNKPRLK